MTRAEQREIKRKLNREIADFLKIQNHYFPNLISDIKKVMGGRNQSYITYEMEVILYVMLLKNICSIESMQEMVYNLIHKKSFIKRMCIYMYVDAHSFLVLHS